MTATNETPPATPRMVDRLSENGKLTAAETAEALCLCDGRNRRTTFNRVSRNSPLCGLAASTAAQLVGLKLKDSATPAGQILEDPETASAVQSVRTLLHWADRNPEAARNSEQCALAFLSSYRITSEAFADRDRSENAAAIASVDHLRPRWPVPGIHQDAKPALRLIAQYAEHFLQRAQANDYQYPADGEGPAHHHRMATVLVMARAMLRPTLTNPTDDDAPGEDDPDDDN